MSRLRAVEHNRTVLVAATSGVSAVIDPQGKVGDRSGLFTAETLVAVMLPWKQDRRGRQGWECFRSTPRSFLAVVGCALAWRRRSSAGWRRAPMPAAAL
jgi:apolipoprotein N-acyltransferase